MSLTVLEMGTSSCPSTADLTEDNQPELKLKQPDVGGIPAPGRSLRAFIMSTEWSLDQCS